MIIRLDAFVPTIGREVPDYYWTPRWLFGLPYHRGSVVQPVFWIPVRKISPIEAAALAMAAIASAFVSLS